MESFVSRDSECLRNLYEDWKLRTSCFVNGQPCQYDFDKSAQIQCKQRILEGTNFLDFSKNEKLDKVKIIYDENTRVNYCCTNSSNIIEVFSCSFAL